MVEALVLPAWLGQFNCDSQALHGYQRGKVQISNNKII